MKSKQKYFTLVVILVLFTFVISACSTSGDSGVSIRTNDLSLDVAGSGFILDANENRVITNLPRTLEGEEDSIINLMALDTEDDFLFWVGDYTEFESERDQRILMNEDKELIAVFENSEVLYMAGNINHAWGHNNVIGYWKAIIGHDELVGEEFQDGTLELYARETIGRERNYLKVSDKEVITGTMSSGEIAYEGPQTANTSPAEFEYIAAIMRVEESINNEVFLFAYAEYQNQQQIEIVILPDDYIELYEDALFEYDENDYTPFKNKIIEIISNYENHEDADYLSGKTIETLNPF